MGKIEICEVGPRDGLQSEPRIWTAEERIDLINRTGAPRRYGGTGIASNPLLFRDRTVVEARQHLETALDTLGGVDLVETVVVELAGLACFVADRDF